MAPPDEAPVTFDEQPVSLRSEHGLVLAEVALEENATIADAWAAAGAGATP